MVFVAAVLWGRDERRRLLQPYETPAAARKCSYADVTQRGVVAFPFLFGSVHLVRVLIFLRTAGAAGFGATMGLLNCTYSSSRSSVRAWGVRKTPQTRKLAQKW